MGAAEAGAVEVLLTPGFYRVRHLGESGTPQAIALVQSGGTSRRRAPPRHAMTH
jgi:hypothetical protein